MSFADSLVNFSGFINILYFALFMFLFIVLFIVYDMYYVAIWSARHQRTRRLISNRREKT